MILKIIHWISFIFIVLGLLPLYWYSACIHAYNNSIEWELFLDRWNYKSKKICRGKFQRKKARKISYGKLNTYNIIFLVFETSNIFPYEKIIFSNTCFDLLNHLRFTKHIKIISSVIPETNTRNIYIVVHKYSEYNST